MKKSLLTILALLMLLAFTVAFTGCGESDDADDIEEKTEAVDDDDEDDDDVKYGLESDDPVELAIKEYLADEIADDYDEADACIPVIHIINTDYTDESDIKCLGVYWVYNYNIEGDTLKCVSGGEYPGCIHLKKEDVDDYEVTAFDQVEDGADYDPSAKKIFGDFYQELIKYGADEKTKDEDRLYAVTDYVNLNGLKCTKFQDEGRDPVELLQN